MTLNVDYSGLGNDQFPHHQIASTLSRKTQQLIILPTEKCNFRCTYCYEDFLIGKMKEPVQVSIERYLDRRVPELSELSIQWFGGEPLLAKQVVLRLSAHANKLCQEHGVSLVGGITTNAYLLTTDLFEELLSCNQRSYQITFDGWQYGHDVVRKMANGGKSFQRIWDNLCATKRLPEQFDIQLRIHVRRDNHENLEVLMENLAKEFGRDVRYSLDFEHLRNLGGPGGNSVERPMSRAELHAVELQLRSQYNAAVENPKSDQPYVEETESSSLTTTPHYICYAAKPNSLLIRADGRIGKCTVALNDDRNTIGKINDDGTLEIENSLLRPWIRGLSDLDRQSLACPLSGLHQYNENKQQQQV